MRGGQWGWGHKSAVSPKDKNLPISGPLLPCAVRMPLAPTPAAKTRCLPGGSSYSPRHQVTGAATALGIRYQVQLQP